MLFSSAELSSGSYDIACPIKRQKDTEPLLDLLWFMRCFNHGWPCYTMVTARFEHGLPWYTMVTARRKHGLPCYNMVTARFEHGLPCCTMVTSECKHGLQCYTMVSAGPKHGIPWYTMVIHKTIVQIQTWLTMFDHGIIWPWLTMVDIAAI